MRLGKENIGIPLCKLDIESHDGFVNQVQKTFQERVKGIDRLTVWDQMRAEFIPRLDFATKEMMKVSAAIRGVYVFGSFIQKGNFNDIDLHLIIEPNKDMGWFNRENVDIKLEKLENKNEMGYAAEDSSITRLFRHFFVNTEGLSQGDTLMNFPVMKKR